jgi:hypothetical protein
MPVTLCPAIDRYDLHSYCPLNSRILALLTAMTLIAIVCVHALAIDR